MILFAKLRRTTAKCLRSPQRNYAPKVNSQRILSFPMGKNTQWRFNGTNISGATSASYTNNSISTNDAGSYTVVASNTSGSVTSQVATTLSSWTFTTNSEFRFTVSRETNLNYIIQASTNLSVSNWVSLKTNTAPFTFTNTAATNYPQRFFRAIYKP